MLALDETIVAIETPARAERGRVIPEGRPAAIVGSAKLV